MICDTDSSVNLHAHPQVTCRVVSPPNEHHYFFGYYDICPWHANGDRLLCLETQFADREPNANDVARLLMVNPDAPDDYVIIGQTTAWNWQMGCRLQWLPTRGLDTFASQSGDSCVVFNDRRDNRFVAVVLDIQTGHQRVLPHPVYAISRDGRYALTLNFARLHDCRPGYGYAGVADPSASVDAPDDDGLYRMNMATGDCELLLSYDQMVAFESHPSMVNRKHWINHLFWGPNDKRITWLHRWHDPVHGWCSRQLAADPDGNHLTQLGDWQRIGHFDWQYDNRLIVHAQRDDQPYECYWVNDPDGTTAPLMAGAFTDNGHTSWSPDRNWVVTDTYPRDGNRMCQLMLLRPADGTRHHVLDVHLPSQFAGACRVDLHPRWRGDGRVICIDIAPHGRRQILTIDVSKLTNELTN